MNGRSPIPRGPAAWTPIDDEDVAAAVDATWDGEEERAAARAALARYGSRAHERETARVRLALVKLCAGSLERLATFVEAARRDYRDVLMWAEYPEEGASLWTAAPAPSDAQRLARVRERDRAQYEEWRRRKRRPG